jgi:hypothetical protein
LLRDGLTAELLKGELDFFVRFFPEGEAFPF